jgi:hypothetical protein
MLQQSHIDELSATHYINKIDHSLTIIAEIKFPQISTNSEGDELVLLYLNVFFHGEKITTLSFNLINYSYEEILQTVRGIKENQFILKEVDDFLSGDIE